MTYYAIACLAMKSQGMKYTVINVPMILEAKSKKAACEMAVDVMLAQYPVSKGWRNHRAAALKIERKK